MKIYLAADLSLRRKLQRLVPKLQALGHTVTSRWISANDEESRPQEMAVYCMADIVVADCILLFTERAAEPGSQLPTGRHFVEFGYALRTNKRAIVLGPLVNEFCHLAEVEQYRTMKEVLHGLG